MTNSSDEYRECDDQEGPVTVTVSRRVKPGREAGYEAWLKHISGVAGRFPGHMGVNVIRPDGVRHKDYVTIVRFDSYRHLRHWEESPERPPSIPLRLGGCSRERLRIFSWYLTSSDSAPAERRLPGPSRQALVTLR